MSEKNSSIIVIADTHFGLNHADETCNPTVFCHFLEWVKDIEKQKQILKLGPWGKEGLTEMEFCPPEKLILLGDIIEMWDASNESIFCSIQNCIKKLSELNFEKIYILGNHDHDISDIFPEKEFSFPLGASEIKVMDGEYNTEFGKKEYRFLHGHTIDSNFRLTMGLWRVMGPIRKAALALGKYSLVLFAFLIANIAFGALGIVNLDLTTLLLASLSAPFLIQQFARKIVNRFSTVKFKSNIAKERIQTRYEMSPEDQWRINSYLPPLTVVYGHTHAIDTQEQQAEDQNGIMKTIYDIYNLPSWVCNSPKSKKGTNELSDVFLYITPNFSPIFVGWDKKERRPYYIPREIVGYKRKNGTLSSYRLVTKNSVVDFNNLKDYLKEIDWPEDSIKKWVN